MIATVIRRFITGPIARLWAYLPFEPVAVFGTVIVVGTYVRDQLAGGADLETALTAAVIFFGTKLVRDNVWPAVKVSADGVVEEPLGEPLTGLEDQD